jgi:hypothetical protein
VGFTDDCKRKALPIWRALLTFILPLAIAAAEAFEQQPNRR